MVQPEEKTLRCVAAADVAQLVERNLAKVEVAGSNPVVRSKQNPRSSQLSAVAWGSSFSR